VRDYIHVEDLAQAHVQALGALNEPRICRTYNLGCGAGGYSVMEVIETAERVTGRRIPVQMADRRPGIRRSSLQVPSASSASWAGALSISNSRRSSLPHGNTCSRMISSVTSVCRPSVWTLRFTVVETRPIKTDRSGVGRG
jgi:hypothetical protein